MGGDPGSGWFPGLQRRLRALPPTAAHTLVHGVGVAEDQPFAGAGHRHVKTIDLFARSGLFLQRPGVDQAVRQSGLAGDEGNTARRWFGHRPVHQQRGTLRLGRLGIGVDQDHRARLQALGPVHGEQLHRRSRCHTGGLDTPGAHRTHKAVDRGKAPAVVGQRGAQQGLHGVQGPGTPRRGHRGRQPGQQVALVHDAVQQIVWRQPPGELDPARQQAPGAGQFGAGERAGTQQSGQPAPARRSGLRQPQQVRVAGAHQRAAQGPGQRQVVPG